MLKAREEFIENFKKLDIEEQNRKVNEMTIEEIDALNEAGFEIEINGGKGEVKCPTTR